jgi:hypothetical protein
MTFETDSKAAAPLEASVSADQNRGAIEPLSDMTNFIH